MIGGRRPLQGRKPADKRVRIERPHAPFFRYVGPGQLVAKPGANVALTPTGRFFARTRAVIFGRPLSTEEEIGERLSKTKALAIFSSDAISSSAYATEEILRVLVLAGASALFLSIQVAIAITVLLAVVSISYRQVCRAYPNGGGAYVVARTNLAPIFGLIAAAALLIDYVMTVAVSTAAAITQIQSVDPGRLRRPHRDRVHLDLADHHRQPPRPARVGEHLRGPDLPVRGPGPRDRRHRGRQHRGRDRRPAPADRRGPVPAADLLEPIGILLLLKAFAGGSVALTGVEAIANGVPAFKPPEAKNAANTMTAMAVLLGILFIGLTVVAVAYGLRPTNPGGASIVALAAQATFGDGSAVLRHLRDLDGADPVPRREHELQRLPAPRRDPRRGRLHAAPVLVPRRPAGLLVGDRAAGRRSRSALLWAFGGDTHALIPLYSVGVFVCFTLSQIGMVRHWLRGPRVRLALADGRSTALGAVLTAVVLAVVVYEKFEAGAYLVVILVPALVGMMLFISHQYSRSKRELAVNPDLVVQALHREERAVVPIPGLNRAVVQAINVARSISDDVRAVYITDDPEIRGAPAHRFRAADARRAAGRRRIAVPRAGRPAPRVPRRARRRVAARQGRADHVRGHPRVRGPLVVGADPLQPGRQAAAHRAARAAAHGGRQRPVPARGPRTCSTPGMPRTGTHRE